MRRFSFRPSLELRGRKFKGLRGFAGKPLHPPLTDVTVGAYTIAPILLIIAFLFKSSTWAEDVQRAGSWVLLIGGISSLGTALTGFADWLNTQKGTQVRRMVNAHAWTMITLTVVVLFDLWYLFLGEGGEYFAEPTGLSLVLALVILGLVTIGGTIGGSLTYDWGFNVEVATDHPVWHPSETDVIHPHDAPSSDGT
ncbi:MAG TPA: DUF2231 domain-containing protein [Actinomycetota bacterium]|nr:DUF2231 domain-containing protein [Actinomycetota bacterium]